jgi:hypothetical protein
MGQWGFFLFSEKLAQLEAFKKTLTDPAEIAKVDAEIAELKAKQSGKQGE